MNEIPDKQEFPWYVRAFYGKNVEPPKAPGMLAFETKHGSEASREAEIKAARSRPDIGKVYWGRR